MPSDAALPAAHARPVKATPVALARDAGVAGAFAALAAHCLAQIRANEAGVRRGRNPEYLHQLRVGLRRLRSLLRLYRPLLPAGVYAALAEESGGLAAVLGAARDWDVFMAGVAAPLARAEPADRDLARWRNRGAAARRRHAQAARQALEAPRYAIFVADVESVVAAAQRDDAPAQDLRALPLETFAAQRLARCEKRVRRRATALEDGDDAALHSLRIAAKKLRYAVEFFRPLFARRVARDYARALAGLQDALGKLNDCASARRLLYNVPTGRDASAHARATARALDWIAGEEQRARAGLTAAGAALHAQRPFW